MPTLAELLQKKGSAGPVIRKEDEPAKRAAEIKQALDATAPKIHPQHPEDTSRELGAIKTGEQVPMDQPLPGSGPAAAAWYDSIHSFETTLGIVIEPDGENAWIAIQSKAHETPMLIHRLPLLNRKVKSGDPF